MNIDDNISECFTACIVKSKYFSNEIVMDDRSSDFQEKKKYNTGPKNVQKAKVSKPKKPLKKIKHQRDIRTLIKNKNSDLVSFSKNFDQVCKKSGVDIDSEQLQLAIALSKSLQESEIRPDDNTQEIKTLTSQERTAKIRTTLQEYGFKVPNTKISKDVNKRRKFKIQYKLLLVADDEKHQNIADKYAEVLARNTHKSPLKSIISNRYNDQELIYKATNVLYEFIRNDDVYYVKDLFEKPLLKPNLLKDWSTIPGRPLSPKREQKNFNFDNIECTQDELDVILSGSILAAQSFIESKYVDNNYNINICNDNSSMRTINAESITISINNELNTLNNTSSEKTKEKINSDTINCIDTMSTITQKVRSVSPDIFDDDISLTLDETTHFVPVLKESFTPTKNNVTEFMDLTECVNIAPERDKTFKNRTLSLKKVNVSNINKSNDFMEITECIPTTAKECHIENIDLTQEFGYSKKGNCSNNIEKENLEMDLTQSSDSDIDLPEESIDARQKKKILESAIVDNKGFEVIPNEVTSNEKLSSPISDYDPKTDFDIENNSKKITNSESHLYEYYTAKKSFKNGNVKKFEMTKSLPLSPKQSNIENVDLTQNFHSLKEVSYSNGINKINVTKRKTNDLMEITECVATIAEQNIVDNIDLTQNITYSKRENHTKNLTKNMQIDLTQMSHSNEEYPLAGVINTNKNPKISLEDSIVIIGDSEFNSDQEINEPNGRAFILQNDLEIADVNDHTIIEDNLKSMIDDDNCVNHSLSKTTNDNNSYLKENCTEIDLNEEQKRNLEIDLTQTNNGPITKTADTENKGLLDDTVPITGDVNYNRTPDKRKDSEYKAKENESDNHDDSCSNDNFYYEQEYNSFVFEHSDDIYSGQNYIHLQNSIVTENLDNDNKSLSCTEPIRNSFNNLDKNHEDKRDVKNLDNIDLTQNSHSSNEAVENQFNPNLGKIDNVSIDYDEMFDHIVSTGSKHASTSLNLPNTSNDSIKKADNSNNEASNHSKTSDFEISDKELNYSLHKSRHNFDLGGLSVLDNVSDFKIQSINDNNRQSKVNLNRSFSDSDLSSVSAKRITVHTPKAVTNSNNLICETSTPVINKCLIEEVQNTPKNSEYVIKTQNVTPMLDYEAMTSPERHRELEKYGLKPFKRKRAIQLLKHLYEQTHPVVESCDIEECSSPSKRRKYENGTQYYNSPGKPKRSPRKSPKKTQRSPKNLEFNLTEPDKENSLYAETKDCPNIKEIKCVPEDWVFQKREKSKVHSCRVPLHIAFHNYVSCRQLLREAILRYEPINIDVVHKDLVAYGYKYNPKDLLRFLDKKCITVKTADNNSRNRKS